MALKVSVLSAEILVKSFSLTFVHFHNARCKLNRFSHKWVTTYRHSDLQESCSSGSWPFLASVSHTEHLLLLDLNEFFPPLGIAESCLVDIAIRMAVYI